VLIGTASLCELSPVRRHIIGKLLLASVQWRDGKRSPQVEEILKFRSVGSAIRKPDKGQEALRRIFVVELIGEGGHELRGECVSKMGRAVKEFSAARDEIEKGLSQSDPTLAPPGISNRKADRSQAGGS